MAPFQSGRRLCLLVEACDTRFALEATSVMEVATPEVGATSLRGALEVKDLSVLLGGTPESAPGMVVVLDVSPTLAVRVRSVVGVANVARAPFFLLPPGLGEGLATVSRGALLHDERLYLELAVDALPQRRSLTRGPPARPVYRVPGAPERALVFESQGRLFGVSLALVSQVVLRGPAFSALPTRGGPVAGLFPHAQALWPVCSAPALLGGPPQAEEYLVLTELAGQSIGLSASRVAGVFSHFEPAEGEGEYVARGLAGPALFLDLQRMFS